MISLRRPAAGWLSLPARQALIGLLALPISAAPFLAYAELTPQGRLLAAKVHVALAPPSLPEYDAATLEQLRARAPRWSGRAAVLVYHGMGATEVEQRWTISPERFADQIATLKAAGMEPITAAELAAARSGQGTLPENAVLISFDDGRTDAFLWADPVLEQADWTATMFLITSEAEEDSLYYEDWEAISDLAATGRWDIQSHTAAMHVEQTVSSGDTLPALTSLAPDESLMEFRSRVTDDLSESSAAITDHIGSVPTAFAYPFGAYGIERTNDRRVRGVLTDAIAQTFTIAFEQDDQGDVPLSGCSGDPLLVRRLEVGDWSGDDLLSRLTRMANEPASRHAVPCPVNR